MLTNFVLSNEKKCSKYFEALRLDARTSYISRRIFLFGFEQNILAWTEKFE